MSVYTLNELLFMKCICTSNFVCAYTHKGLPLLKITIVLVGVHCKYKYGICTPTNTIVIGCTYRYTYTYHCCWSILIAIEYNVELTTHMCC